ncbi:hypothetical protein [Paraburkholderia agricolaris]|uniref:hypothetical protein n=1 Tax=Paraburkholderia agricolaris TaxID=2152888 RepID=UPI0012914880|nr:hypothetical protein [Paraburkholderia agricolaris]
MDLDQSKDDEGEREYLKGLRATFKDEIVVLKLAGPMGMQYWESRVVRHRLADASDDELLMLYPMPK